MFMRFIKAKPQEEESSSHVISRVYELESKLDWLWSDLLEKFDEFKATVLSMATAESEIKESMKAKAHLSLERMPLSPVDKQAVIAMLESATR